MMAIKQVQFLGQPAVLMRTSLLMLLVLLLSACKVQFNTGNADAGATNEEKAQTRATALAILGALDANESVRVWDEAAPSLKRTLNAETWTSINASRVTFGPLRTRTFLEQAFPKKVENLPPGRHAVVYFSSSFEHYPHVQEEVVMTLEDGRWKLSGYWARMLDSPPAAAASQH